MAWDKVKDRDQRFNVDATKKAEQRADIPHWEPHPESDSAWHKGKDAKNQPPPAAKSKDELGTSKNDPSGTRSATGSARQKNQLGSLNDPPEGTYVASGSGERFTSSENSV